VNLVTSLVTIALGSYGVIKRVLLNCVCGGLCSDKLPTRLNLEKRGIIIPTNLCHLRKKAEESVQHVFVSCEVEQKVWDNCDRWIGISSVRQHTIVNHYQNFYLLCCNKKANVVWKGVWVAVVWEIWYHRNRIVFKNGVVDDVEIFTLAQLKAWSWAKFRWLRVNYSVSDWLICPQICLGSIT